MTKVAALRLGYSLVFMFAVIAGCRSSPVATTAVPFSQAHAAASAWWPKAEAAFIAGDPAVLTDLLIT